MELDDAEIDAQIDDIIENGFKPAEWMSQMERVVDSYKTEVEQLRIGMRAYQRKMKDWDQRLKALEAEAAKSRPVMKQIQEISHAAARGSVGTPDQSAGMASGRALTRDGAHDDADPGT